MDRHIKLALDIVGIFISVISLGLLIANEYFLLVVLISVAVCVILFFTYKHATSEQYDMKEVHYEYLLKDEQGEIADVKKTKIFKINEKNISHIFDHRISTTGQVEDITTNIGTISEVKDSGGALSVVTAFDEPLVLNDVITHILQYRGLNSFTEKDESVSCVIGHKLEKGSIKLTFPDTRMPTNIKATSILRNRKKDVSKSTLSKENTSYVLSINKPKTGAVYALEWTW